MKFQQQFQNFLAKYNKIVSQKQYNAELEDMKNDENLHIKNHQESTLLHRAVEMGLVGFTKFLLSCGLNPNFAEGSGITPLLLAILRAKSKSRIVKTLIDAKASTDGSLYATLPDPLDLAKHIGNPGIIAAIEKARERKSIIVQRLADLDSRTCQAPPTIQPLEDTDKKPIMQWICCPCCWRCWNLQDKCTSNEEVIIDHKLHNHCCTDPLLPCLGPHPTLVLNK